MKHVISLERGQWWYDDAKRLGRKGGFGEVFVGASADGSEVAVKRLNIDAHEAAHRELTIARELGVRSFAHIIPVLDGGQDAESDGYFIVMAKADRSLQAEIDRVGRLDSEAAADILLQIARGLREVAEIVHRDLKPDNVLLHEGKWKVADFGIARFVEESTSLNTLRGFLTPPYAAPEQWNNERATGKTDLYALGCIGYALLTGKPPFSGGWDEYQAHHLRSIPKLIPGADPRLQSLLSNMLRKSPDGRPTLPRVITVLDSILSSPRIEVTDPAVADLAKAVAATVAEREESDARERRAADLATVRRALADEAKNGLAEEIIASMLRKIADNITDASVSWLRVTVGTASLSVELEKGTVPVSAFEAAGWDVAAGAAIQVHQIAGESYLWGASLWYGKIGRGDDYRWYEVAYMENPLLRPRRRHVPFPLFGDPAEAGKAASPGTDKYQHAFGPVPIDFESLDGFHSRWIGLFAKAIRGELSYPRSLPFGESGYE